MPDQEVAATKSEPKFELGQPISFNDVMGDKADNSLQKIEEKTEEVAETKKEEIKTEEKKDEVVDTAQKEEKAEEKTAPIIPDWKELILKENNKKEVYKLLQIDEDELNLSKELKSDEFVKKMLTYRKEHGNLTPFIDAATRDWDKVPHDQLIMDDLKKQYSYLSPDKADKLAKSDFNQRFVYKNDPNLDETENAEMAELMALKLESEGEKIRAARKTEQKQFLDSVKPVDKTAEAQRLVAEKEAADKKELEQFSAMYDADPASIKLNAEKKIVLGKEKPFNYSVNPESIKAQTLDTNKFYSKFWIEKDGKEVFNTDLWNRVVAYSENPTAFEDALINHGMSQGTKEVVEKELENVKEKTDTSTKQVKKSLAKTFAEEGQAITLGELMGQ